MIHVIATIELNPGTRAAFLVEFNKNIPAVLAEDGCIEYGPAVDAQTGIPTQTVLGPDRVTIIEKWASVEALKAHSVAPHMKAYRERVKDYVRGMDLRVLSPA
ncbi:MAG: antibiotic biosynthesis monooxygenase [Burkholderiales bacterium]|nr:antibiotic biosynthesis monooxygenase [Burkholderiales bacterium]